MTYSINIAQEGRGSGPDGFASIDGAIAAAQPWVDGGDWPGAEDGETIEVLVWDDDADEIVRSVTCTIPAAA